MNKTSNNLRFVCGLFFNYYYFITDIIYKDEDKTIKIENVEDIRNFQEIYQRHFIIGTEETGSISFSNMIVMLFMYGFVPININKREAGKEYDSNVIFYNVDSIEKIYFKNLMMI